MNYILGITTFFLPSILIFNILNRVIDNLFLKENDCYLGKRLLAISLVLPLSISFSSCIYFLWCIILGPATRFFGIAEIIIYLLILFVVHRSLGIDNKLSKKIKFDISILPFLFIFILFSLISLNTFLNHSFSSPYGNWDAYAIWNLKARFIFRGGNDWWNLFNSTVSSSHIDYPLLLPLTIARGWYYIGVDAKFVPVLIQFIFSSSIIFLMLSFIAIVRGWKTALIFTTIYIYTSDIAGTAASQYSDLPLSYYFLAAVCFASGIFGKLFKPNFSVFFLLTFLLSSATWTKNEGIPYLGIIIFLTFILNIKNKIFIAQNLKGLFLGGILILPCLIGFKLLLAPSNDVIGKGLIEKSDIFDKILDIDRYKMICGFFYDFMFSRFEILGFLIGSTLCLGRYKDINSVKLGIFILLAFTLQLVGYFAIYIITPHDLNWHLSTSLSRLVFQVYGIMIIGMATLLPSFENR